MTRASVLPLALLLLATLAPACSEDSASQPAPVADVAGTGATPDGPAAADASAGDIATAPDPGPAEDTTPPEDIPPPPPVVAVAELGGAFFDLPYPSDLRRTAAGRLDLTGFPNPSSNPILTSYVTYANEVLDGFSLTPAITFRFSGALKVQAMPTGPDTRSETSALQLLDVTPESPTYGQRTAVDVTWWGTHPSVYVATNSLTMTAVFGTPLREGTTYAAVVTTALVDNADQPVVPAPAVADGLAGTGPLAGLLAPLAARLADGDALTAGDIATATVFTTGTPTAELRAVRQFIAEQPDPPALDDDAPIVAGTGGPTYLMYEGRYWTPNFQAGAKPYDQDGDIRFDADGKPIVQEMESVRFALAVPKQLPMPEAGWPLVLYGHGTGGNWKSFTASGISPAKQLTAVGMAVLSIDQPLHGERYDKPLSLELYSFNYVNPRSGRSSIRQSAIDVIAQVRFVRETLVIPAGEAGNEAEIRIDPSEVRYFGHSHGGISGVMVMALEPGLRSAVLSGAGGGLSYTLMLRKDPFDLKRALDSLLKIENPAELGVGHPVVALMQNLVDATDPLSYGALLRREGTPWGPASVLFTEGFHDQQTPYSTTDFLAAAARIPILAPPHHESVGHTLQGLSPAERPVTGNYVNGVGQGTSVLAHFGDNDHFAVFDNKDAAALYVEFLTSGLGPGKIPSLD